MKSQLIDGIPQLFTFAIQRRLQDDTNEIALCKEFCIPLALDLQFINDVQYKPGEEVEDYAERLKVVLMPWLYFTLIETRLVSLKNINFFELMETE